MTSRAATILVALSVLAGGWGLAGCSGAEPPHQMMMAGPLVPNADNPPATCAVPTGPWGFSVGREQQPWTVSGCGGESYALYNDDFCRATFTVVVHSEPWCGACLVDAPSMRANLIDPYAAMDVRVLEVLQQTLSYDTVTPATCDAWAAEYDSAGYVFMDPMRNLSTYTYRMGVDETPPGSHTEALPTVNIYDAAGTLVFHHEGATNHWRDITVALDGLLAGHTP